MAVTIDYGVYPYDIQIPKTYMVQLQASPEIRQLDMDVLHQDLRDIEDDEEGIVFPTTHNHNAPFTVSGANLARVVTFNTTDYKVTFEDGAYRVNVVGANTDIAEISTVNNVSVSTSNSAGLQDLNSLQIASFVGGVAVKPSSPYSGTTFPIGTRSFPVNNVDDAVTIANLRGLNVLFILETMTLTSDVTGFVIQGDSAVTETLTISPSANVFNATFQNLTITGTLDGASIIRQCVIQTLDYVSGVVVECAINGTITVSGGAQASLLECYSGVAGGGPGQTANIDMDGGGNSLILRDYDGGVTIENYAGGGDISLDINSGRVIVASTVTAGNVYIRGVADVTDNSTGTANVVDQTLNQLTRDMAYGAKALRPSPDGGITPGYILVYDASDTIVGYKEIYEDEAQTVGWQGPPTSLSIYYESILYPGSPP